MDARALFQPVTCVTGWLNDNRIVENDRSCVNPTRNLHFIMGTMASHPKTFIIIGMLRTGVDPEVLSKQREMF